jgi:calpain-15
MLNDGSLYKHLVKCARLNLPTTASTSNEKDSKEMGLVEDHCYSLLDIREVQGHKLCLLRNPWSRFEWKGDWSDQSRLWTQEIKQAVNFNADGDDGEFWMV